MQESGLYQSLRAEFPSGAAGRVPRKFKSPGRLLYPEQEWLLTCWLDIKQSAVLCDGAMGTPALRQGDLY